MTYMLELVALVVGAVMLGMCGGYVVWARPRPEAPVTRVPATGKSDA